MGHPPDIASVFATTPVLAGNMQKSLGLNDAQFESLVKALGTMHFDGLKTAADVKKRWDDLELDMKKRWECKCSPEQMLADLGVIVHAAQDFYAHSNFTELALAQGYTAKNMPSYHDWVAGKTTIPADADLHTGSYPSANDDPRGHTMMNHDTPYDLGTFPGHARHAQAMAAMRVTLNHILDKFEKMVGSECLTKIKNLQLQRISQQQYQNRLNLMKLMATSAGQYTGDRGRSASILYGK